MNNEYNRTWTPNPTVSKASVVQNIKTHKSTIDRYKRNMNVDIFRIVLWPNTAIFILFDTIPKNMIIINDMIANITLFDA